MRWLALFACLALAACSKSSTSVQPSAVAQGNGSSGIGNLVPVAAGLRTTMASADSIKVSGDVIVDGKTGEKLLSIEPAPANPQPGPNLVPAQLGTLQGFEYLPRNGSGGGNYWIVCGSANACYRLSPLSTTNAKVPAIIGGLSSP